MYTHIIYIAGGETTVTPVPMRHNSVPEDMDSTRHNRQVINENDGRVLLRPAVWIDQGLEQLAADGSRGITRDCAITSLD